MSVTVVTQIQRVVVRGSGASYSDARVLAYLRTLLTTNGDLLTVASNTLARIAVGAAPAGSVPIWNGSSWSVGTLTVAVAWDDVTGKPSTFPPSTHSHTPADVTGFNAAAVDAVEAVGNGVLVTTGGTAAAVTGATTNHALLWNGTTWVAGAVPYSALSGVPSTFAPSSHTHTASEITDFNTAWTARLTALGSGASTGDALLWNGSAWAAGAQSGGGMTNPMTTAWDLIRGGASGTPTRLAVGTGLTRIAVTADGSLAYRPGGSPVHPLARHGTWHTVTTGAPTTVGPIAFTRTSSSTSSGGNCRFNGGVYQINQSAASSGSYASVAAVLATATNRWLPAYAAVYMATHILTSNGTVGLYVTSSFSPAGLTLLDGPPAAPVAFGTAQGYGLQWATADGTTGTIKFVVATTTEYEVVDTGIKWTEDGSNTKQLALLIWQDEDGVHGQIWDVASWPVLLWSGGSAIASFIDSMSSQSMSVWSIAKTLAASAAHVVHAGGSGGLLTGVNGR